MKLNEIRAFVTVAGTGSIQTASERLHLTQSAVSRLIQRLELELGVSLFDRQTKPLALTADGRIALEHGRCVLTSVEAFSDALAPDAAPSGLLRIGTAHALAELVAEHPLGAMRDLFPHLTPQISADWATSMIERLRGDDLDAALITLLTDGEPSQDLPQRRLRRERVDIIGAATLDPRDWHSLVVMNTLGWVIQPQGCGYRTELALALRSMGPEPLNVVVESFGNDLQLSTVGRGLGFGLLPASQVRAASSRAPVCAFRVPDFDMSVSTWFVRKARPGRLASALDAIEGVIARTLGA